MQCLLCRHDYDIKSNNECPICNFPTVNFPAGVSIEEGIKSIKPVIDNHKKDFEKNVTISAVVYQWELSDVQLIKSREEKVSFGQLAELVNNTVWLSHKFDKLSERAEVELRLCVEINNSAGASKYDLVITVPNLSEKSEQELGISVTDEYLFSIAVRNTTGCSVNSGQKYLFEQMG